MQILLLNMTYNRGGWENETVNRLRSQLEDFNTVRFFEVSDILEIPYEIFEDYYDFVIIVAHGDEVGTGAIPEIDLRFTYPVLAQIIPSVEASHKLLLICEGANESAIAELCIVNDTNPQDELKLMIAKRTSVTQDEVVQLIPSLFRRINETISSNERPTATNIRQGAQGLLDEQDWLIVNCTNIKS